MFAGIKMLLSGSRSWALAGLLVVASAGAAGAASNPTSCVNDIDCVATPQCGGDVCDFNSPNPMTCKPAGSGAKGSDGWCTKDSDCKCASLGAKCLAPYCTFTKPSDAPGAGSAGTNGAAGTSGAAGSHTSDGGAAGTSGSDAGKSSGGSSGGCSVGGSSSGALAALLGLALVAGGVRRRRRG